jgi:hypothetical protein
MKILINERRLILEKTFDLDVDVDWIYDKFFKKDIETIQKTRRIGRGMFKPQKITTASLKSAQAKEAHKIKPCTIYINLPDAPRAYQPFSRNIFVAVNRNAVDFVIKKMRGDLDLAIEYTDPMIEVEFASMTIKSNIYHELSHWLDDVFHGEALSREVDKWMKADEKPKEAIISSIEINAQIHTIKQMKRSLGDKWEEMTFSDLLSVLPIYNVIRKQFLGKPFKIYRWEKKLKQRMHREGLLGKNMRD